jgi:hypothetical protein
VVGVGVQGLLVLGGVGVQGPQVLGGLAGQGRQVLGGLAGQGRQVLGGLAGQGRQVLRGGLTGQGRQVLQEPLHLLSYHLLHAWPQVQVNSKKVGFPRISFKIRIHFFAITPDFDQFRV